MSKKVPKTLYEIREDMAAIDSLLMEMGGDVSDKDVEATIDKWFTEIEDDEANKVEGYCRVIRTYQARAQMCAEEMARLKKVASTCAAAAERLERRLIWFMKDRGKKQIAANTFDVRTRRNGGVQPMEVDDGPVPTEYTTYNPQPDNALIRQALEDGVELDFARLRERGTRITIK